MPTPQESNHRHYEIALLVHPGQSDQVPSMLTRYRNIVTEHGGVVHREEDWGRRQLAYLIDNLPKAHYLLMNVEGTPAMLNELKSAFQYNDAVLRNLTVSRRRAISEQSPIMKETLREQARERENREASEARSRARVSDTPSPKPDSSPGEDQDDSNAERPSHADTEH